jgi:hypothetical protein
MQVARPYASLQNTKSKAEVIASLRHTHDIYPKKQILEACASRDPYIVSALLKKSRAGDSVGLTVQILHRTEARSCP